MFKNAKVVKEAKPAKAGKAEVEMPGLKTHAEIDALIKALTTIKGTLDVELKIEAMDKFMELGQNGIRPESFRGIDGTASASIELRKRSTMSPLTTEQVALLAAHNVSVETLVGTHKMFGINPTYTENTDLLDKVEAALAGIVPEDFIVVQEEKSKIVVGEKTMIEAFANKAPRAVIEAITVLAIKPKLAVTDIAAIMDSVKEMIAATPTVLDSQKAAA
jgi:hypothetical protein